MQTSIIELALSRYIEAMRRQDVLFSTATLTMTEKENTQETYWILTNRYSNGCFYNQIDTLSELVYYMASVSGIIQS